MSNKSGILVYKNISCFAGNQVVIKCFALLCCVFSLTSCDFLTPKLQAPNDASGKRSICEAIVPENDCVKSTGCGFYKKSSNEGKCKLKADAGKPCRELSKAECELIDFGNQDCFLFTAQCRSDDDFDGNGFDKIDKKHRNTGTLADLTGRNIDGILIVPAAPAPIVPPFIGGGHVGAPLAPPVVVEGGDADDPVDPPVVDAEEDPIDDDPIEEDAAEVDPPAFPAAADIEPAPEVDFHEPPQAGGAIEARWQALRTAVVERLLRENPGLRIEGENLVSVDEEVNQFREFMPNALDFDIAEEVSNDYRDHIIALIRVNAPELNPAPLVPGNEGQADIEGIVQQLIDDRGLQEAVRNNPEMLGEIRIQALANANDADATDARGFLLGHPEGAHIDGSFFGLLDDARIGVDAFGFTREGGFAPAISRNWMGQLIDQEVDFFGFDFQGTHRGVLVNNARNGTGGERDHDGYTRSQRIRVGGREENGRIVDILHPDASGFFLTGFNALGRYRDYGVFSSEIGFRSSGIHIVTNGITGPDNRDFLGYDPYGFNYLGLHKNGTRYDAQGLDVHRRGVYGARYAPNITDQCRVVLAQGQEVQYFPAEYENGEQFIAAIEQECQILIDSPLIHFAYDSLDSMRNGLRWFLAGTHVLPNIPPTRLVQNYGYVINNLNRDHGSFLRAYVEQFSNIPRRQIQSVRFLNEAGNDAGALRREFKNLLANSFIRDFRTEDDIRNGENEARGPMFLPIYGGRMKLNEKFADFAQCSSLETKEDCWQNIGKAFAYLSFYESEGVHTVKLPYGTLAGILNRPMDTLPRLLAAAKLDDPQFFQGIMQNLCFAQDDVVGLDLVDFPEGGFSRDIWLQYLQDELLKHTVQKTENIEFIAGFLSIADFVRNELYDVKPSALALILEGTPPTLNMIESYYQFHALGIKQNDLDRDSVIKVIRELNEEIVDAYEKELFLRKLLAYWTGYPNLPQRGLMLKIDFLERAEQPAPLREALIRAGACERKLYVLQDAEINALQGIGLKEARENALKEALRVNINAPLIFNRQ